MNTYVEKNITIFVHVYTYIYIYKSKYCEQGKYVVINKCVCMYIYIHTYMHIYIYLYIFYGHIDTHRHARYLCTVYIIPGDFGQIEWSNPVLR